MKNIGNRKAKNYDEAIGLADWLFDNTSLTLEQIAEYSRVSMQTMLNVSNGTAADFINQVNPIESGWLSQTDINRCQLMANANLPRSTTRDAAFDLSIISDDEYPNEQEVFHAVGLHKVAFIRYGRNAWHSTWIQRYYLNGSIQPSLIRAKQTAEKWRKSGSVLNIDILPAVFLRSNKRIVFIVEINIGGHMKRFSDLCEKATSLTDTMSMIGSFSPNTLLFLEEQNDWSFDDQDNSPTLEWKTHRAKPSQAGHRLAWEASKIEPDALSHATAAIRSLRNCMTDQSPDRSRNT